MNRKEVNRIKGGAGKQLATSYTQEDYDQALADIYRYSTDELFGIGKEFRHK